jgi:hypothetical protein
MFGGLKRYKILAMLLAAVLAANSQPPLESVIKAQALEMVRALINNDFATFSKFVHPKIMEASGGPAQMKSGMDSAAAYKKQFGVEVKKILIGNPGAIIRYHDQLQCVLQENTDLQTLMGTLSVESSLIGISEDNGKRWYFLDNNMYRAAKLKNALPELSPNLDIPTQKPPVFKADTKP